MQWTQHHDGNCLTQFVVLRLDRNDRTRTYKTVAVYRPEIQISDWLMYEAHVSPGENQFLLKPSNVLYNRFGLKTEKPDYMSVINIERRRCRPHTSATRQRSSSLDSSDIYKGQGRSSRNQDQGRMLHLAECIHDKDIFHDECQDFIYAYDPRFQRDRIAMGGPNSDTVALFDLCENGVLCRSKTTILRHQRMARLVFSPDGRFLVGLIGYFVKRDLIVMYGSVLYNSDNLEIIQHIDFSATGPFTTELHRSYLLPEFSANGAYVALPIDKMDSHGEYAALHVALCTVPFEVNLLKLCRFYILRYVCVTDIYSLPLPTPLKNYLLFRPYAFPSYMDTVLS